MRERVRERERERESQHVIEREEREGGAMLINFTFLPHVGGLSGIRDIKSS